MKPSLESILKESLGQLQSLNPEDTSPVETLETLTLEEIQQDSLNHIQQERYNSEDGLRGVIEDYLEKNEEDHARIKADIQEVRETVGTVVSSMEMLSLLASMESIDNTAVVAANAALSNIAHQAGEEAPVVVAEDGQITDVSMESVVDFVKKALSNLRKWIKEKFQNMALAFRRGTNSRVAIAKRIGAAQARLNSLPSDYGIPAKAVRYSTDFTPLIYRAGAILPFDKKSLAVAAAEAVETLKKGVNEISTTGVKYSTVLGDAIGQAMIARDEFSADQVLRKAFKEASGEWPVQKLVKVDHELAGGMTFLAPDTNIRINYRDAEWIMELVRFMRTNQARVMYRRSGQGPSQISELPDLQEVLNTVSDILNDPALNDYSYYTEISIAWNEAQKVYERMMTMAMNMHMGHLNNELWRAVDIGTTAMFEILQKSYYQTETFRAPPFRLIHGLLYVVEEQLKAYVAVNR